jgi:hypothetical protein
MTFPCKQEKEKCFSSIKRLGFDMHEQGFGIAAGVGLARGGL